jgi:hypothetical protein
VPLPIEAFLESLNREDPMAISRSVLAVSASAAIVWLAASTPSSADFLLKNASGRCMHVSTSLKAPGVGTAKCQNALGFIATNASNGIFFRTALAPAAQFNCVHVVLPNLQKDKITFPVKVIQNNCAAPLTHFDIVTAISVSDTLPPNVSICLEETSKHRVVGKSCNGTDAQKWEKVSVP